MARAGGTASGKERGDDSSVSAEAGPWQRRDVGR